MSRQVPWAVTLLAAGLLAAAAYAASPLSVWVLVVALVAARALGRNLPADERRMFYGLFAAAFAARVLFVCARFLAATPDLNDLSIGGLGGDEA
jgi:hypothetical protein